MNIDDTFIQIGQFGWYSRILFMFMIFVKIFASMQPLAQVFLAGKSEHWCATSEWETVDCEEYRYTEQECAFAKRNVSIPYGKDGYLSCKKYDVSGVPFNPYEPVNTSLPIVECDDGWDYDRSQYEQTIITDFELVCDKKNLTNYAQSVYFLGYLVGSVIFGWLADKFGRKNSLIISTLGLGFCGIICSFSPSYWSYTVMRFFIGATYNGSLLMMFVMATEFSGPKWRTFAGIGIMYAYSLGAICLSGVAYLFRPWRTLMLVMSIPVAVTGFLTLLVDESPRWLVTVDRNEQAEKVFTKIARINRTKLDAPIVVTGDPKEEPTESPSILELFKNSTLRWRTLNLMFNWFVHSIVYYGLSLSTSDFGVNDYIAFFISAAVEIPAYCLGIYTMDTLGRKISTGGFMIFGGVFCLMTIFTPLGPWTLIIAMLGKFGITLTFGNIYVVSAENFPTPLRSSGMALCSCASRIGGILCPFILLLSDIWEPIPLLIFGTSSLVAGSLMFFLPETLNKPLPQTIEEAVQLDKIQPRKMKNDPIDETKKEEII